MGNSMGKKRKMANAPSTKHKLDSHVVPMMTSSSLQNIVVEFPKEIEEDLERRKIESFKALAEQKKKPARTTSAPAFAAADPAQNFYEKARALDVPAVMVPKPWSEVDQILSKFKTSDSSASPVAKRPVDKPVETQQPETIDMSDLMEDLEEEDEDKDEEKAQKKEAFEEIIKPSTESVVTPEDVTPKKVRSLETSLSFSTIHTVKEVESGNAKPETVTNFLKSRSPAGKKSSSAVIAPTTPSPRKVNVNPRLLARMEAFM